MDHFGVVFNKFLFGLPDEHIYFFNENLKFIRNKLKLLKKKTKIKWKKITRKIRSEHPLRSQIMLTHT
jgi:hypothetical protein